MTPALSILILALTFAFGLLCLESPMTIARAIAWWTRLALGKDLPHARHNPTLLEALTLMNEDPEKYQERFDNQISLIKRTGILAVAIAILGACMILIKQ